MYEKSTLAKLYLNCLNLAVYSLTGTSFNDVYPVSQLEIYIVLAFLISGGLIYGKIFGDCEKTMLMLEREREMKRNKFEKTKQFCFDREVSPAIRKKVKDFFTKNEENYYQRKINYFSKYLLTFD